MNPVEVTTRSGEIVVVRNPVAEDIPEILQLHRRCFPSMVDEEGGAWTTAHYESHFSVFPVMGIGVRLFTH